MKTKLLTVIAINAGLAFGSFVQAKEKHEEENINSSEVPEAVDVDVSDGWVTLTGDVGYQFQSDAAFDDVAGLYGVLGVTNEITVEHP